MKLRIAISFALLSAVCALAAWLGTELVMAPAGTERTQLIAMFAAIAAAVFVLGVALSAVTRTSLSGRILAIAIAGPLVVASVTAIGAWSMFFSSQDTQFVLILTALATALAVGLVQLLAAPILRDMRRIAVAAQQLGRGDLSARTSLQRKDEVGDLSQAFDAMADRISADGAERAELEAERRFLMSSLSHDARTPLTAMRAAVEALQDGLAPDPDRYLRSIERDLTAIESIVENLFLLGQIDAKRVEPRVQSTNIVEVASDVLSALEPLAARRNVELVIDDHRNDDEPPPLIVNADPHHLARVFTNLLSNAIRHSPEHGRVAIELSRTPMPQVIVRDQGAGFPAEFASRAFQQFTRAEADRSRATGGAGLGLAVVKGLIEAHAGTVFIGDPPGGAVGFTLPEVRPL